jgi:dihydroorotate dehydrogenase (NAD+) catalytic subunit
MTTRADSPALLPFEVRGPLLNASGTLGFAPNPHGSVCLDGLGAFVTNPVSLAPRTPAEQRCALDYPVGFLLHTGLPNPGLHAVLRQYAPRWARSPIPVILSLLADDPFELARMVAEIESIEPVAALEIGLPPHGQTAAALDLLRAAAGELPVIALVPPERLRELGPSLAAAGANAVSLAAPRGALQNESGEWVEGRLYGSALLPQALAAVRTAREYGLPVIGGGGVYTRAAVDLMLRAGASAVQLDSVLWNDGLA